MSPCFDGLGSLAQTFAPSGTARPQDVDLQELEALNFLR